MDVCGYGLGSGISLTLLGFPLIFINKKGLVSTASLCFLRICLS